MNKVVIVNCFDTYEDRIDLLHEFFISKGHEVTVIQSDFRHIKKVHRNESKPGFIFVQSKPYYKNMSASRLKSHYEFAKSAFEIVNNIKPDILYVVIPPNSLAKFATQYKRKNINTKLIFDLIDLWPETMPVGKIKKLPPFTFWRLMRDNNLIDADSVITECDLYQTKLSKVLKKTKTNTLHLAKREIDLDIKPKLNSKEIHLAYLGSINNIIDIPKIKEIIKSIRKIKPVELHIIGDGESKGILIEEIKKTGAKAMYHGKIYDPHKKQEIFNRCHFGLNIMKDTVCVGLTMKSIDYFQAGLPILNNIQADTFELVDHYNVGFNISNQNLEQIIKRVTHIDNADLITMRINSENVYRNLFSIDAFNKKLEEIFEDFSKE